MLETLSEQLADRAAELRRELAVELANLAKRRPGHVEAQQPALRLPPSRLPTVDDELSESPVFLDGG